MLCASLVGQSIGVRGGILLSNLDGVNLSSGGGVSLEIADTLDKYRLFFAIDHWAANERFFDDCEECPTPTMSTSYTNTSLNMGVLIRVISTQRTGLFIGPSISHDKVDFARRGRGLNWLETISFKSLVGGLILNYKVVDVVFPKVDLEITVNPKYSFKLLDSKDVTHGILTDLFTNNRTIVFQIGISYPLEP